MQEKDLATLAHEAVEQGPPPSGMPTMREEAPVVVPPHEPMHYDCDIVILGGGGAGLVAAARISETTDKKVVVVEKRRNFGGGAMGAADWRVYGSRWQKDHGIPDNTMDALRSVMDDTYRIGVLYARPVASHGSAGALPGVDPVPRGCRCLQALDIGIRR